VPAGTETLNDGALRCFARDPDNGAVIARLTRPYAIEDRPGLIRKLEQLQEKHPSAAVERVLFRLRNNIPDPPVPASESPDSVNPMELGTHPDMKPDVHFWHDSDVLRCPPDCRWRLPCSVSRETVKQILTQTSPSRMCEHMLRSRRNSPLIAEFFGRVSAASPRQKQGRKECSALLRSFSRSRSFRSRPPAPRIRTNSSRRVSMRPSRPCPTRTTTPRRFPTRRSRFGAWAARTHEPEQDGDGQTGNGCRACARHRRHCRARCRTRPRASRLVRYGLRA
jgi:hypothetical protein